MDNEIIKKYYSDIFKWSFAKTRNRYDAEDLTQDIIFQIIKAFGKDIVILDIEKYIWKIAYYTWCNSAKKYIKEKQITSNEFVLNNQKDATIDIEKTIEFEEIKDVLNKTIDTFTDKMKNCVSLYYFNDFGVKDISEKLNIKESLVKYYLYEARNKIRRDLNVNN